MTPFESGGEGIPRSESSSTIEVVGHGFAIDGVAVSSGDITALSGLLTGTLDSGDALSTQFERVAGLGTIRIIANPEPATGTLLGLVVLGLRRRR